MLVVGCALGRAVACTGRSERLLSPVGTYFNPLLQGVREAALLSWGRGSPLRSTHELHAEATSRPWIFKLPSGFLLTGEGNAFYYQFYHPV